MREQHLTFSFDCTWEIPSPLGHYSCADQTCSQQGDSGWRIKTLVSADSSSLADEQVGHF